MPTINVTKISEKLATFPINRRKKILAQVQDEIQFINGINMKSKELLENIYNFAKLRSWESTFKSDLNLLILIKYPYEVSNDFLQFLNEYPVLLKVFFIKINSYYDYQLHEPYISIEFVPNDSYLESSNLIPKITELQKD